MSRGLSLVRPDASDLDVVRAAQMLASCKSIDFAREVRDKAKAITLYQRTRGASIEAQNDAAEITLRAERRLGELLREAPKATGTAGKGRPKKGGTREAPPKSVATLEEQGIGKKEASRWQKLATVPEERFEAHVTAVRSRAERLTTSGVIAAASHVEGYDGDEHYTPAEYIEAARTVLDEIDLDPASNALAQKVVLAKKYWTKEDDALDAKRVWKGRVWMNPPYSRGLIAAFVARLLEAYSRHLVSAAVVLVNACTDTDWFHQLAEVGPVCFTDRRIAFVRPDGAPAEGNRMGQAFFYLGPETERFEEVFSSFGLVGQLRRAS